MAEDYWDQYTPIQQAKHDVLGGYLAAWYPILASWNGRVLYVETHAGRGRHRDGQPGSPLVALQTLLDHRQRDRILSTCEVRFILMEKDPPSYTELEANIKALGELPKGIVVETANTSFDTALAEGFADLEAAGNRLAPALFFIDPFGYDLPMPLLRRILGHSSSELLVTFMYGFIVRAMGMRKEAHEANMDSLFGNVDWRALRNVADPVSKHQQAISMYASELGCAHSSVLQMRGDNNVPVYDLVHATNHARGREAMKDAMWKVTQDGSFVVYKAATPDQMVLIEPEPDLSLLKTALLSSFRGQCVGHQVLSTWLLDTNWRIPHLNSVLRELRNGKIVNVDGYTGTWGPTKGMYTFPPAGG